MVTLDFADAELAQVIETIARATNRNFIYDDRVRGRVTIVSPEPIPVEQAYAVFESVLQVKGFTTVHDARRRDQGDPGARGEGVEHRDGARARSGRRTATRSSRA